MSTEAILVDIYNLAKRVRTNAELGLPVSMRMVLRELSAISKRINRSNFPKEISYHVDGLITYMTNNMELTANMNSLRWRFVLQGLETVSARIDEFYYQMGRYAPGTNLKASVIPPTHFAAVSACNMAKQNKTYSDIMEQLRDAEHVRANQLNYYHDDAWLAANTPKGQTAYEYEVANGYQDPIDPNCLEMYTRGRNQMSIPNETTWNNPDPEYRKDMRVPYVNVPLVVRNDPSINDWNGRMRFNESASSQSFRY